MTRQRTVLILKITILAAFLFGSSTASPFNDAKENALEKAGEFVAVEKAAEEAREEVLIEHFYRDGRKLFREEKYIAAADQFSHVLEIDPGHKGAKKGLKAVRKELEKKRLEKSPPVMAKKLLKSGRLKYVDKDYEGAIEDFQNALVMDHTNKDAMKWLKKAHHRLKLKKANAEQDDVLKDTEIAQQEKAVQERLAMLDVEKAYLLPEEPKRVPVEIEAIISPEEEREEKKRQKLMEKLREKMVPAINLTNADIRDAIRQFMEITGVTIIIDEGALAEAAGKEPLKLTFSTVNPFPLLEVLDVALKATELCYRVEPNYIWISTPEKLEKENMVTRIYRLKYGARRIRKVEIKEYKSSEGAPGGD
ncbi:MAG: hypothetical protein U9R52_02855 [Candidatus Omnitrophota bacterium]|nr:hypothetical protein [Candidatus Omnitrophota bacterium]